MTDLKRQDNADPVGLERILFMNAYSESQMGWSPRFDAAVWNEAVVAAVAAAPGTPVRRVERHLRMEIWNNSTEAWEDLPLDDYVCGVSGVFHLIRRRGVTVCKDFDVVRAAIEASVNIPSILPLSYIHFYKQDAPYSIYPPVN